MSGSNEYIFLTWWGTRHWLLVLNGEQKYFLRLTFRESICVGLNKYTLLGSFFGGDRYLDKIVKFNHINADYNPDEIIDLKNIILVKIFMNHWLRDKIEIMTNSISRTFWFENSGQSAKFAAEFKILFEDKVEIIDCSRRINQNENQIDD